MRKGKRRHQASRSAADHHGRCGLNGGAGGCGSLGFGMLGHRVDPTKQQMLLGFVVPSTV
jgi:hypothetical protein